LNTAEARSLALSLIAEHGLSDWHFAFNRRRLTFGLCDYSHRTVYLSSVLTELNDEAQVRDTILHEIAHALAGHKAGHGPTWKEVAAKVGAKPQRCFDTAEVRQPAAKYELHCPNCQAVMTRYRKPKRTYACHACCERYNGGRFSQRFKLKLVSTEIVRTLKAATQMEDTKL
jgi:predicted SprT family Zn-dependent metalloprotease